MKEEATLLAQVPLFAGLKSAHLAELAGKLALRNYEPRTTIFNKDDRGSTLYIIKNGQVKISAPSPEGEEVILAMMTDGDFFGELSILDLKPRSATATAMEPTSVFTLDRDDFLDVVHAEPDLAIDTLAALSERLRRTNILVEDAFFLDLPTRLVKRLLELAEKHGRETDRGLKIDMLMTQEDLASVVGASSKSVNRLLGDLQDQGLIFIDKNKNLYILGLGELRKLTVQGLIQRPIRRYERSRERNALLVLLFGSGLLIFVVGLATGLLSIPHSFLGAVAMWVIALALLVFWGTRQRDEAIDYEPEW